MRRNLMFILFFACCSSAAFGQVTLTAANYNPVAGDAYIATGCDVSTGITPGLSGTGVTWNFGSLIPMTSYNGISVPCASNPNCVPGSNLAVVSTTGPLVNSFLTSSAKYSQTGIYVSATDKTVYTDPLDLLRFPFSYNSTFIDTVEGTITHGPITINHQGTVNVLCDGLGTLIVPGNTYYNVLRVHSSELFIDSVLYLSSSIDTFQFDTYNWYMPGYHSPIMTITFAQQVNGPINYTLASYFARSFTKVADVPNIEGSLELFPNPANDELNIKYNARTDGKVRVSLTDILGREAAVISNEVVAGPQHIKYNTTNLPKGLYVVHLQSGDESIAGKIQIQ
jgi:hypothetical protein